MKAESEVSVLQNTNLQWAVPLKATTHSSCRLITTCGRRSVKIRWKL